MTKTITVYEKIFDQMLQKQFKNVLALFYLSHVERNFIIVPKKKEKFYLINP
jgi:hypothetical protein